MKKIAHYLSIALFSALISGCFGESSRHAINSEIHNKCRDGSMRFIDSYECSNLVIDKYIAATRDDFDIDKLKIESCIGNSKTHALELMNEERIRLAGKTRPSFWSRLPFISPKNSTLSRAENLRVSDDGVALETARETFVKSLDEGQKTCLTKVRFWSSF